MRVTIFLPLALNIPSVEVDQDAYENDSEGNSACSLDSFSPTSRLQTYTMQIVIVLATLVLVGFSQVLLPLLSLHVAVDADESVVPDDERPITRLGDISQALFTPCSSTTTRLPMLGTRGSIDISVLRAIMPSMVMRLNRSDSPHVPRSFSAGFGLY